MICQEWKRMRKRKKVANYALATRRTWLKDEFHHLPPFLLLFSFPFSLFSGESSLGWLWGGEWWSLPSSSDNGLLFFFFHLPLEPLFVLVIPTLSLSLFLQGLSSSKRVVSEVKWITRWRRVPIKPLFTQGSGNICDLQFFRRLDHLSPVSHFLSLSLTHSPQSPPWHLLQVSQMCSFLFRHLIMAWFYCENISPSNSRWIKKANKEGGGMEMERKTEFHCCELAESCKRENIHSLIVEYISHPLEETSLLTCLSSSQSSNLIGMRWSELPARLKDGEIDPIFAGIICKWKWLLKEGRWWQRSGKVISMIAFFCCRIQDPNLWKKRERETAMKFEIYVILKSFVAAVWSTLSSWILIALCPWQMARTVL